MEKTKCGQIFIHSPGNFSFVCEVCAKDYFNLDDFGLHINHHFPKFLTQIKEEDPLSSCGNEFETIPLEIYDVKQENWTDTDDLDLQCAATESFDDHHQYDAGASENVAIKYSKLIHTSSEYKSPMNHTEEHIPYPQQLSKGTAINLKVKSNTMQILGRENARSFLRNERTSKTTLKLSLIILVYKNGRKERAFSVFLLFLSQ